MGNRANEAEYKAAEVMIELIEGYVGDLHSVPWHLITLHDLAKLLLTLRPELAEERPIIVTYLKGYID